MTARKIKKKQINKQRKKIKWSNKKARGSKTRKIFGEDRQNWPKKNIIQH